MLYILMGLCFVSALVGMYPAILMQGKADEQQKRLGPAVSWSQVAWRWVWGPASSFLQVVVLIALFVPAMGPARYLSIVHENGSSGSRWWWCLSLPFTLLTLAIVLHVLFAVRGGLKKALAIYGGYLAGNSTAALFERWFGLRP